MKAQPAIKFSYGPHMPSSNAVCKVYWTEDGENFFVTPDVYISLRTVKHHPTEVDAYELLRDISEQLLAYVLEDAKSEKFKRKLWELSNKQKYGFLALKRGEWVPVK